MTETVQAVVVTLAAAGALAVLVRSYLPARDARPRRSAKASGCASCAQDENSRRP
jgi:hypothetical protein